MFGGVRGDGRGPTWCARAVVLWGLGIDDWSRSPRAAAALHHGDRRHAHHADGLPVGAAHGRRHLPQHRHPGRLRRLELSRPLRRGHGTARRAGQRALLFHHGQRHRAHRVAVDPRARHPQGLFHAGHRHRRRHLADQRAEQFDPAHRAARHHAAEHDPVQRVERAGGAGHAQQQDAARAADLRLRHSTSCASSCSPFPGLSIPAPYGGKQRQIIVDVDPAQAQRQGLVADGRGQRAADHQRHRAGRHRPHRRARIQRQAQLQPADGRAVPDICRSAFATA